MKRKLLSVLLTFCLAFSLLPTAALAEEPADPVAQIGEKTYATLKAAFEEAKDGDTVTLLGNVTELETISITGGKKVDLNLNEKNITFKADNYFLVDNGALNVTGKGNITSSHGNDNNTWLPTIYAYGTDTDTANYSVVTVGKDVVIDNRGSYGLAIGHKDYKAYGAKVIVEGTVKSTYGFTVTGNAKATQGNIPEITVTESGKIVSTDGSAIYAAGYGIYTIAGTLSGTEFGIEIRAGKLNVEDTAKISATGNFSDPVPNGNGSTVTGAAIAVSQHTTNLPIDVNIKGGEISETGTNGHALYEIDTVRNEEAGNVAKDVSITVSGGSFNGNVYSTNNKLSITGGAFTDIANAVKYAADGATIKLADDVTRNSGMIEVRKPLTVDLNTHKLTSPGGFDIYADLTVKNGQMETVNWAAWVQNGAKLVVDKDVMIKATSTAADKGGIAIQHNGSAVTIYGSVEAAGGNTVSGIGNKEDGGVTINIEDGAVIKNTNEGGLGIYYPNTAELNIKGGTITGATGVYVKSGKTTITGGVINGTGAKKDYEYYGNGAVTTGDAFVVDKCNYPGGDPTVEIKGGYFNSANAASVGSYVGNGATGLVTGFVTGGYFTSDPSAYKAEGKFVVASDKAGYSYMISGTAPTKAEVIVNDKTAVTVPTNENLTNEDKSAIQTKTNIDGVAEAVAGSKDAIVKKAGVDASKVDATKLIEVEVAVDVAVSDVQKNAEGTAISTITFTAKPTATVKVDGTEKGTVPVSNDMLNNKPITVKLPLPAGFTPKQILHKFTGGGYEYFINESVGGMRGAGRFKIEDNCAVFTIYGFSTFELSGTVTYVEPSYSSGSSYDPTYSITVDKSKNGAVTVSPKSASKGDRVTVTVKPDSGYVLETLTVTDKNGNELTLKDKGDGKYTFTMPAGKVEVKATFMEDNSMLNFFYDVPNNAYFYEAVKWAVKNGITTGVGNNLFAPEQPCTRAQIVTFLWRAAGSPEPKGAASGMTDVVSGGYYEKAVAWAIENGITTGTTTTTFSPDVTCTRAQAVTFLARALKAKAASAAEFSDVPTGSYFADAVAWAAANGVTEGIGGGLFGSDNDCTRGQIVTFLYRAYNK